MADMIVHEDGSLADFIEIVKKTSTKGYEPYHNLHFHFEGENLIITPGGHLSFDVFYRTIITYIKPSLIRFLTIITHFDNVKIRIFSYDTCEFLIGYHQGFLHDRDQYL